MGDDVAIIVPVLDRPANIGPLIYNVSRTTAKGYRLLFVVCEDDDAELAALEAAGADRLVVPRQRMSWACKVNDGFEATDQEWVFAGADDIRFHDGWFQRALRWADETTGVIGTNDICNPRVMMGEHSTHTLFRRSYVDAFGTIDERGKVMHEGYRHDFTDDEAVATARARGVYVHAFDSIVEHLHPLNGKSPDDKTYRMGRRWSADGRKLFTRRKVLWADEARVRMSMIPAPERAVVVTATYGAYDSDLHVPVGQDMPVEWVCFTDQPDLEAPEPWRVVVAEPHWPDDPRMSAKVAKMLPEVGCDDVVWMDASHEVTHPSFVREALASRRDGLAVFEHPRRACLFAELDALLGPENQNGLYWSRPLEEQKAAYRAEGIPEHAGFFACGVVAWDLSDPKARSFGQAWLEETERWSHQDQPEFAAVAYRMGISPGTFPLQQIDPKLARGKRYLANRWVNIHPHVVVEPPLPVSVLIPFTSKDPERKANLDFVAERYRQKGWEVVIGSCAGEWSKGAALADAFTKATHDVLVIADADCLLDDPSLMQAVRYVLDGSPWVVPHRRTWRLDAPATRRILSGGPLRPQGAVQRAVIGGGVVVCSREAWEAVGGIDARFLLWGGEDLSFGWALSTLVGPPILGAGKLLHLWHPMHKPRKGTPDSEALAGRYRQANGDSVKMHDLIAEAWLRKAPAIG